MCSRVEIFGKVYKVGDIERLEITLEEAHNKVNLLIHLKNRPKPEIHSVAFATDAEKQVAVAMLEAKKAEVESRKAAAEANEVFVNLLERSDSIDIARSSARWGKQAEKEEELRQEREKLQFQLQQARENNRTLQEASRLAHEEFLRQQVLYRRARDWWQEDWLEREIRQGERLLEQEREPERSRSRSWGLER